MIKFNTIEMTARAEDYVRDRAMTAHQLVTFAVREIILAVHPDEPTQQERPMSGDQDEVGEVAYVDILCGGLWEECRGRNAKAMADVLAKRGYAIVRVPRKVDPIDRPFTHEPEQDGAAKYNEAKPDIDHFGAEIKAPRSIPRHVETATHGLMGERRGGSIQSGERAMSEHLLLKWGTVKGWDNFSERSQDIIKRFFEDGMCMSAAADHPDEKRKAILCELIDQLDGEIQNDWSGEAMTKDEAKEYVKSYGQKPAHSAPSRR